jgi:hypothetical protein
MTARPVAQYRLYDRHGALLYIGQSVDPRRRWREHRLEMLWWPEVDRHTLEWLPQPPAGVGRWHYGALEADAIRAENPRYNKSVFDLDADRRPLGPVLPPGVPPQPWGARWAYQFRELRPMHRQRWFLWRLLLQDGLETEREALLRDVENRFGPDAGQAAPISPGDR